MNCLTRATNYLAVSILAYDNHDISDGNHDISDGSHDISDGNHDTSEGNHDTSDSNHDKPDGNYDVITHQMESFDFYSWPRLRGKATQRLRLVVFRLCIPPEPRDPSSLSSLSSSLTGSVDLVEMHRQRHGSLAYLRQLGLLK